MIANLTGALPSTGKYVNSVTVAAGNTGQIVITYGGQANAKINGSLLDISPGLSANNDVVWICGKAGVVGIAALATAPPADASNVPPQYLPTICHA